MALSHDLRPILAEIQAEGITSYRATAEALNAREIKALRGGRWTPKQVARLKQRLDA